MKFLGWSLPIVLLLALAGAAYSTFMLHRTIQSADRPTLTGPIWFVSGLQADVLKFQKELINFKLGTATASDVALRYDILWSRAEVATTGETFDAIKQRVSDATVLLDLFDTIRSIERDIVELEPQSRRSVVEAISVFDRHEKPLRALQLELLEHRSRTEAAFRETLLGVDRQKNFIFTMILGLVVALIAYLLIARSKQINELSEKARLLQLAHRANEAKSNFLSVVNHELRTPLTSISGAIRLLDETSFADEPRIGKLIDLASRNCVQLTKIIDDILDIERIERGTISCNFEEVQVCAVVDRCVESLTDFAASRGIKLSVDYSSDGICVQADQSRLTQVLGNLLSNAVKFSSEDSTVLVSVNSSNEACKVIVRDEGRGIPKDVLPHIFEKFYQAEEADRRNHNGSGLGLHIVQAIINVHGGEIEVESVVGKGSTFTVTLPYSGDRKEKDSPLAAA